MTDNMTEQLKQAAQQALDALKKKRGHWGQGHDQLNTEAIAALERALTTSQPAQAGEVDERANAAAYMLRAEQAMKRRWDQVREQCERMLKNAQEEAARIIVGAQPAAQATPEPVGVQTTPTFAQLKQILDGLARCHAHDSRVEFLRTWIRDWTQHKLNQATATPPQQAAGEPVGEPFKVEQCMQVASDEFDAFLIGGCKGEPPRMSMAFASTLFKTIIRERGMFFTHPAPGVPEGFALVPVEPTKEMIDYVRWKEYGESSIRLSPVDDETVRSVWDSMLAAAQAKGGA